MARKHSLDVLEERLKRVVSARPATYDAAWERELWDARIAFLKAGGSDRIASMIMNPPKGAK